MREQTIRLLARVILTTQIRPMTQKIAYYLLKLAGVFDTLWKGYNGQIRSDIRYIETDTD